MSLPALPEELEELPVPVYGPYELARSYLEPHHRLLDVGCGNGKVSAYLAQSGATVDGIEPTATRGASAAGRVRYLSTKNAGEHDDRLLPEYDFITFFDVIEHIPDPQPVLDWAFGRLAPGGRIIASIPNSAHISFRRKMLKGDWSMHDWGLFDRTHLRFYDPTSMLALTPEGAVVQDRAFFAPGARSGVKAQLLKAWPALFALHVTLVWRAETPPAT